MSARAIVEARDGTIWAGGTGGLARFRTGRWEPVELGSEYPKMTVTALTEDAQGSLWVSTSHSLFRKAAGSDGFERLSSGFLDARVSSNERGIVIASGAGLATLPVGTRDFHVDPIAPFPLTGPFPILHDSRHHIWIGTNGQGLLQLRESASQILRLTERDGLAGDLVRAIFEDREGNIWIGTQSGVTRVTEATIRSVSTQEGATAEQISTLVANDDGELLVQVPDGLMRLSPTKHDLYRSIAGIDLRLISAMRADPDQHQTWIATGDGHVLRYARGNFEVVAFKTVPLGPISAIECDRQGHLWLFDGRRFIVLDLATKSDRVVDTPAYFRANQKHFALIDENDRVWLGSEGGTVAVYDGSKFRVYGKADGLPDGQLSGIYQNRHRSGRIWLASDNGLSALDGNRFVTLTTRNGLPRDRIFFIVEDDNQHIWLGIGSGLVRVDSQELERALVDPKYRIRYRLFDASDGLHGTPVFRGTPTAVRATDGEIWFVTSSGLSVIDPQRVSSTAARSTPAIDEILVNGEPIPANSGLTLPSRTSSLQIRYTALNLTSPSKVRFRHWLEGLETEWIDDGSNKQAVYAHLAPGAYRFHIAATGGDGTWTESSAIWAFSIPPSWYQTRSFYALLVVIAGLLVWGTWRIRVRQIQMHYGLVLAERARVGREIHDTLLQSLVGMGLQLENLTSELHKPAEHLAGEIDRMRRQVQEYIEEAQQSIWELRSPGVKRRELGDTLCNLGQRIVHGTGIAFSSHVSGTFPTLPEDMERELVRIVHEALVNAVRHADATEVCLEIAYAGNALHVQVTDNGRGFNPSATQRQGESHWGMSIMRERAEQIGANLAVSSSAGHGTSIEITAPIMARA
jgi:signal transduction histidine kinase/ligand-binding sensor domain-containing protein